MSCQLLQHVHLSNSNITAIKPTFMKAAVLESCGFTCMTILDAAVCVAVVFL